VASVLTASRKIYPIANGLTASESVGLPAGSDDNLKTRSAGG
jgi:hypothetical protein